MKKIGLIILITLGLNFAYSLDTVSTSEIDSTQIESVVSADTNNPEKLDANAEKNAQWFMYGFLALGGFLVVWKFKNNK